MDNRPIGIFDSGVGGLTVAAEAMKALPDEEFIYFGDTARVPYGSKSKETVTKFSRQIVNFLLNQNVKLLIVACGTISSNSLDVLPLEYSVPFIDVIPPGVDSCLEATENNVVGVIGTEATIRSRRYETLLTEKRPGIRVYSKACPLFVPLAEEGWTSNEIAELTAEVYLRELIEKGIDTLVLGCTHYPLLVSAIQKVTGDVRIVNPAIASAQRIKQFLLEHALQTQKKGTPPTFYVSDNTDKFNRICRLALHKDYSAVKIDLDTP